MILPEKFKERMRSQLGAEFEVFVQSLDYEVQTSIRINHQKFTRNAGLVPVNYCSSGYYLKKRPFFTLDPFIHSGVYYVQESSSMFLEQAIKQTSKDSAIKVLDLCAAPGGKSTHLASLISERSLLVSNEVIRSRSIILSENLKKWGNPNVIVTNNDPQDFNRLSGFFDIIVVDAPCSGEGLFRKDPNAIVEWSPENTQLCAKRQQRILADVWSALKDGGLLIYSTCTYNHSENEENIEWLDKHATIEPVNLELSENCGITRTSANGFPCYRFYPHLVDGEGFFMAVVRKRGLEPVSALRKVRDNPFVVSRTEKESGYKWLNDHKMEILNFENSLLAFPSDLVNDLIMVKNNLRIVHAGVKIGEIKHKDIIPVHELSLSTILNRSIFPEYDLTLKESITYLKRNDIIVRLPKLGYLLMTYRNIPIGWVKNLGNRSNSLFPKEWRIRMETAEFQDDKLLEEQLKFPMQ